MRPRPLAFAALALIASASLIPGSAHADFDPKGKKPKKPPVVQPGGGGKPGGAAKPPGGAKPPDEKEPVGEDELGIPKKDPVRKAAVIALARPGESGPVLKLAQVYRERDGSLDVGVADWKALSSGQQVGLEPKTKAQVLDIKAKSEAVLADPKSPDAQKEKAKKIVAMADDILARQSPLNGLVKTDDDKWAALLAYAGILKSDKRDKEAMLAYEEAAKQKPDRATVWIAIARLKQDSGDLKGAVAVYEKALPLHKDKFEKEATLRSLMELHVDLKDYSAAKKVHNDLVAQNKDSMTVRAELARTYFKKNHFERAEEEYQEVAKAAAGDNRVYASALLDLGLAQLKLQKYEQAVATLEKGLGVAGAEAGAKTRLLNALAEAYRAQNKLEAFVEKLEKQNPGDVDRQELLGKLAAEFDSEKAIKWLSKALGSAPTRTDARVLLIRLLKEQSRLDDAVKQYELLIQHAKGQPQFVFELCDLLIGRGERPKCLAKLKGMEAQAATDPDIQQRLALYYSQIGEDKLALALMEKLAGKNADDPSYIVDLGDYWYQRGQTAKAKEIWKRLTVVVKPKAKGFAALGETYLDHDLGEDALEAYKQARDLAPGDLQVQKGHATALERVHKYAEAQGLWDAILKRNDVDKPTRREARTHLVLLWVAQKKLEPQVAPLTATFKGPPADLEAGRLLAEVQMHLRRLPDAEKTLRSIIDQAPGDVDARLVLERVLVQQGNVAGAIAVLEELVKADPKGARQYYGRLAQYSLQLYKDDEAIRWAAAAVELSPEDADGHKKLGEMYRSQQDFPKAIKEFKLAIQHNPKLWAVYFELAELLLAQGDEVSADALYRRVMRGSTDDELVASAIRFSAAINQKRGTLEVLETELLPIALGNPQKVVYRRLLVEVYANLTAPLVYKVKAGGPDAAEAHTRLLKVGQRGVQPLIDALSDQDISQQRTAIEILAFVENRSAGAPLFAYATGTADPSLRARAMVACGALRDPALLPKYEAYLFPKSGPMPKDPIAVAAAFGVARIDDKKAVPLQKQLVETVEPVPIEMRIFGAIALGRTKDKAHVPTLDTLSKNGLSYARAAALYALGEIGEPTSRAAIEASVQTTTDAVVRSMAVLSLARTSTPGKKGGAKPPAITEGQLGTLTDGVLDPNERVRRASSIALAALAAGEFRAVPDPLPVPDGPLSAENAIAALIPKSYGPKDFSRALVLYEKAFASAVSTAMQTSKDRAIVALDTMLAPSPKGTAAFGPFTQGEAASEKVPPSGTSAGDSAAKIADAAEPFVAGLVHHPDVNVQTRAIRWLGRRETKVARDALVDALDVETLDVQRLAIEELSTRGDAGAVAPLARILATHKQWSLRADAARALGAIGKRDGKAAVVAPLEKAATSDGYAFVREAALRAIATAARPGAKATLESAAKTDPEPRVREVAAALAKGA
ncbi:MAG: tetratricopeptide repeat protein [Deltaproteobacteria bacterium]|nr:tetratricopeptide repeat protein [Deltaproteobacteria bacterium]